jgi:hypothetical protein
MGIWLDAWAGDHAGQVEGRQPYRALISLTHTDGQFPVALHQFGDLDGTTWYYNIYATCLTPGSKSAIVTKVDDIGDYVWSLELRPWEFGNDQLAPWATGVHLFSIMMLGGGGSLSGTIATVVIPSRRAEIVKPFKFSQFAAQQVMQRRMDR